MEKWAQLEKEQECAHIFYKTQTTWFFGWSLLVITWQSILLVQMTILFSWTIRIDYLKTEDNIVIGEHFSILMM